MKLHNVEQGSEAWERLRQGRPTSSAFSKIITALGKPSKQWENYAYHLIAERMLGRAVDTYKSPAMERGNFLEQDAVDWYEFHRQVPVKKVGFITNDAETIGCSPDRLIGDDGLLEIKCPEPQTQVRYLITGKLEDEYRPQIQGQLYISERKWVDIVAWHPELTRTIIRVERNEEYIACLAAQLKEFIEFIDTVMQKIKQLSE